MPPVPTEARNELATNNQSAPVRNASARSQLVSELAIAGMGTEMHRAGDRSVPCRLETIPDLRVGGVKNQAAGTTTMNQSANPKGEKRAAPAVMRHKKLID